MADIRMDTVMVPFRIIDVSRPGPLVFASPHSGRVYPTELLRRTRLKVSALRRGEDRNVDGLIRGVAAHGAPCVLGEVARAYIDLNRHPDELDPELFDLPPDTRPTSRVTAGLGVIPRAFAPGEPIYGAKLPLEEAQTRIRSVHTPYHAEVHRLLERARALHGHALLIDCHSMPSLPGGPRVVVGDLHGRSAAPQVSDLVIAGMRDLGLSVVHNLPYAGAYTLERHGRPAAGIHAVQIEFDRAMYLDGVVGTLLPGAARLAEKIARLAAELSRRLHALHAGRGYSIAAE